MDPTQVQLAISLLAAHVVGDFALQTDEGAKRKHRIPVLAGHCVAVAALSYALTGLWLAWQVPAAVLATHMIIDLVKARFLPARLSFFVLDQLAHVSVILAISVLAPRMLPGVHDSFWQVALGANYYAALILLTGLITAVYAGGVVVGFGVKPFLGALQGEEGTTDRIDAEPARMRRKGFDEGGKVIGRLERAMIYILILAGQPSSIGFLIAAKSLLRFGEIGAGASRKEVEYIIIGTLMSFLVALLAAYLTRFALLGYQAGWPGN